MNMSEIDDVFSSVHELVIEIEELLIEVRDYDDILAFLFQTEIEERNLTLDSTIDEYERLIKELKIKHDKIEEIINDFGDMEDILKSINESDDLSKSAKNLILWKVRRVFMLYNEEKVIPYIETDIENLNFGSGNEIIKEVIEKAVNEAAQEVIKINQDEELEPDNNENDDQGINPNGDLFQNKATESV